LFAGARYCWTFASSGVVAKKVQDANKIWQGPGGELHIRRLSVVRAEGASSIEYTGYSCAGQSMLLRWKRSARLLLKTSIVLPSRTLTTSGGVPEEGEAGPSKSSSSIQLLGMQIPRYYCLSL